MTTLPHGQYLELSNGGPEMLSQTAHTSRFAVKSYG